MQHILSKMRKAIEEYQMIEEGDKIAVCLSTAFKSDKKHHNLSDINILQLSA